MVKSRMSVWDELRSLDNLCFGFTDDEGEIGDLLKRG